MSNEYLIKGKNPHENNDRLSATIAIPSSHSSSSMCIGDGGVGGGGVTTVSHEEYKNNFYQI